jgi:hypothetical protein
MQQRQLGFDCNEYKIPYKGKFIGDKFGFEETIPSNRVTSFNAVSATRIIKVYDKSFETKREYHKSARRRGESTQLELENLTRIEFVLYRDEIPAWFKTNNLFQITQETLNDVFHGLVKNFIRTPLDEYYREIDIVVEKYFEAIDVSVRGWRQIFTKDLLSALKNSPSYSIRECDLPGLVKLINAKSFKDRMPKIIKSIRDEILSLPETAGITITNEREYIVLTNWLMTISDEEQQSIHYYIA